MMKKTDGVGEAEGACSKTERQERLERPPDRTATCRCFSRYAQLTCEPQKADQTTSNTTARTIFLDLDSQLRRLKGRRECTRGPRRHADLAWGPQKLFLSVNPRPESLGCVALVLMHRRLLAVSAAVLAPALGQAFVATATGSVGSRSNALPSRTALARSAAPLHRDQHPVTMAAATIVGGGRIGCALYVSVAFFVSNWIT